MNCSVTTATDSISYRVLTPVTISYPVNVYVYQAKNVLIAYCITGVAAVVANLLGLYALHTSNVSHDLSFSSIVCATQGIHFSGLEIHEKLGALPLEKYTAKIRLKFCADGDHRGFSADDSVQPS